MNRQIYELTGRALALTDVLPSQDAAGAAEAGKNTITELKALLGAPSYAKVTMSSAEVLNGFTVPKTIIAAPGAGKVIFPLGAMARLIYATTPYAANLNLQVGMASLNFALFTSILDEAVDVIMIAPGLSAVSGFFGNINDYINQPVVASVPIGNPTGGDSPVDIYLTYIVITL